MDPQTLAAHLGLDLLAVALLTFAVFSPRHRRRELVPAYLALNVALYARDRRAVVTLDAVYREETALHAELARRLGEPLGWTVQEVDHVRDLMVLEVRFRQPEPSGPRREFVQRSRKHVKEQKEQKELKEQSEQQSCNHPTRTSRPVAHPR
ncbi:DUF4956 domain-containing protein [Streptomyces sp. PmtG]